MELRERDMGPTVDRWTISPKPTKPNENLLALHQVSAGPFYKWVWLSSSVCVCGQQHLIPLMRIYVYTTRSKSNPSTFIRKNKTSKPKGTIKTHTNSIFLFKKELIK